MQRAAFLHLLIHLPEEGDAFMCSGQTPSSVADKSCQWTLVGSTHADMQNLAVIWKKCEDSKRCNFFLLYLYIYIHSFLSVPNMLLLWLIARTVRFEPFPRRHRQKRSTGNNSSSIQTALALCRFSTRSTKYSPPKMTGTEHDVSKIKKCNFFKNIQMCGN